MINTKSTHYYWDFLLNLELNFSLNQADLVGSTIAVAPGTVSTVFRMEE